MRPFGGFADQLREKTTNILLLAVLLYVVLSLAACAGEQRPSAGGLAAPTETIAVKRGPTQQATLLRWQRPYHRLHRPFGSPRLRQVGKPQPL